MPVRAKIMVKCKTNITHLHEQKHGRDYFLAPFCDILAFFFA